MLTRFASMRSADENHPITPVCAPLPISSRNEPSMSDREALAPPLDSFLRRPRGSGTWPLKSKLASSQMGDPGRHVLHQEAQALVVPPGIVGVGRDREERAEAATVLVE